MSPFIAALPMYDWPETRGHTDAQWADLRDALRAAGIDPPEHVARRNADLPAVAGGIRDRAGQVIAPDPSTLPPDGLDAGTLWRHPALLLSQTCWGPMERGLAGHVNVVGQPDYSGFEGGQGPLYSSAIVMRAGEAERMAAPRDGRSVIPLAAIRGRRLAYNDGDSMSGIIALTRDLEVLGDGLDLFASRMETGSHRASARAVAEGRADVCAIDCRTWALVQRYEPEAGKLMIVGWTARRKGLPYICSNLLDDRTLETVRGVVSADGNQRSRSSQG